MTVALASFADCVDLASDALGGEVLTATDDFFAAKENLLKDAPAVFDPKAYTDRGKLMDGWESRRKRTAGHDSCILRLGVPGLVRGFDIDTSWFMGNQPQFGSIEGCVAPAGLSGEELAEFDGWTEILGQVPLDAGSHNLFAASRVDEFTHLRLHIYPDGGVARLRVYGIPRPSSAVGADLDLAALQSGGRAIGASDMFYGDANNLLRPGRAENMGGGWETKRRRDTAHDWVVVRLAGRGTIRRIVVDTHHNKGNFPDRCTIEGLDDANAGPYRIERRTDWTPIVGMTSLQADHAHAFDGDELASTGPFTHVRLRVYPDGGVSRFRVFGALEPAVDLASTLNGLSVEACRDVLLRCCGSTAWADAMVASRPFADPTAVLLRADEVWWTLNAAAWHEAFEHHPRIGDDPERLRKKFADTARWAGGEQAGVRGASEETLAALESGNADYEARFGHVFLICATGLTADQMLGALQRRLPHDPAHELRVAAGEQAKITRIRLDKLAADA